MNEDQQDDQQEHSAIEATEQHPYMPGYGVTDKFPQDEADAGDVTSEPASEADQLTTPKDPDPQLSEPAASGDQLDVPPAQGSTTA